MPFDDRIHKETSDGRNDAAQHHAALGMGFWASKATLSAVELGVFTELAAGRGEVVRVEEGGGYRVKIPGYQYPITVHEHAIEQIFKYRPPKSRPPRDNPGD
ncbi:hypothetical protein LAC81_34530 (plasmid) [Ensifer adhaerens]|nr:hypothetical protein [Ensifer adhaerens]MBZ7927076.1 hypothetical protein [Ensifer adhaerens]UAX98452.1 hypothetical protein LAC78_35830 [Ensifer adhaerens]UAY05833.1 hypothetical protein LAC80_34535 [Ensifer adhaerens]UAY13209.1 hypothetical protein LAC81_34530 [Ensifer adhaerens]